MERAHLWVSGRVQGVSFRAYTGREAVRLGLAGWVRNSDDGRVEAEFEGPRPVVDAMIAWCHRGSPSARVSAVDVSWVAPLGDSGFEIRR
jgi:acylphosphatase